jgi:hypothetical protein
MGSQKFQSHVALRGDLEFDFAVNENRVGNELSIIREYDTVKAHDNQP